MVSQEYNRLSTQTFYKKSSDQFPSGCANGSTLIEVDTGAVYKYDYEHDSWLPTTLFGSKCQCVMWLLFDR